MPRHEQTLLTKWLLEMLRKHNLSAREASIRAGMSHGLVSYYLSGNTPSPDSCRKLAALFGEPPELVLQLAGHINPPPEQDLFLRRIAEIAADWTEEEKEMFVQMARAFGQRSR
jgi:transcriptional regulator with XRE-family HTH domain